MLSERRLLAVLNDGLLRVATSDFSYDYGSQLWTRGKLRKTKKCCNCDTEMLPKTEAFSPITNGYNRMYRICLGCVERMKATHEAP